MVSMPQLCKKYSPVCQTHSKTQRRMWMLLGLVDVLRDTASEVSALHCLSCRDYLELPDRRVRWIDETRAPFTRRNFEGARRPAGWLFQQALKLWTIAYIAELCNDVIVLDSDVLWLREFDVRVHPRKAAAGVGSSASHSAGQHHHTSSVALSITGGRRAAAGSAPPAPVVVPHCPLVQRYKYCLSSMDTGAWYGDITNPEYQHFVKWFLGMPKELADTHTGINNWQVRRFAL